jgi:uncharacterized SAM-binding protein YcdF (DUF218 family)
MVSTREFAGKRAQVRCTTSTLKRLTNTRRSLVALLLLLVWCFVAWAAARLLIVESPLATADVIVVLSGSSAYKERNQFAAALYQQKLSPQIILTADYERSGWSQEEQRNPFFYERSRAELVSHGVPLTAITVLPQPVFSTIDEAMLIKKLSLESGLRSVLIVTSPYHSRRAQQTFAKVFLGSPVVIGIAHPETGFESPDPKTWWLYSAGWRTVAVEWVKLTYYKMRYSV